MRLKRPGKVIFCKEFFNWFIFSFGFSQVVRMYYVFTISWHPNRQKWYVGMCTIVHVQLADEGKLMGL